MQGNQVGCGLESMDVSESDESSLQLILLPKVRHYLGAGYKF